MSPTKPGKKPEISRARVSSDAALTQRNATLTAARSVEFSANKSSVVSSADHKVQADYAANVMASAKDEAVALVDSNRRDEAGALLRNRADELAKMAAVYKNSAVQRVAAPAAAEADRLEREGLGVAERKAYRAESAQTVNQQNSR